MVATYRQGTRLTVGYSPISCLTTVRIEYSWRLTVLRLAGDLAAVAADAALEVDHYCQSHRTSPIFANLHLDAQIEIEIDGLVRSQVSSSRSLKNTPCPLALGKPFAQWLARPATPMPSGWMHSVSFT